MEHTSYIGKVSEANALASLLNAGYTVSIPFSDVVYDFIADDNDRLIRIQCKTGRLKDGVIIARTTQSQWDEGTYKAAHYNDGDLDAFVIYCPEMDQCYLVPFDDCPSTRISLRVDPTKNGQQKGIRWAEDYIL